MLVLIQLYKLIFIQNLKVVNLFFSRAQKKGDFFFNSSCIKTPLLLCSNHRSAGLVYSSKRGGSTTYKTIYSSIKRRNYTSLGSPPRRGGPSLAPGKAWTSPRPAGASLPLRNANLNGTTLRSTSLTPPSPPPKRGGLAGAGEVPRPPLTPPVREEGGASTLDSNFLQ